MKTTVADIQERQSYEIQSLRVLQLTAVCFQVIKSQQKGWARRQVMFLRQASELNLSFVTIAHPAWKWASEGNASCNPLVSFRNEIILQFFFFKTQSNYFNNFRAERWGFT